MEIQNYKSLEMFEIQSVIDYKTFAVIIFYVSHVFSQCIMSYKGGTEDFWWAVSEIKTKTFFKVSGKMCPLKLIFRGIFSFLQI